MTCSKFLKLYLNTDTYLFTKFINTPFPQSSDGYIITFKSFKAYDKCGNEYYIQWNFNCVIDATSTEQFQPCSSRIVVSRMDDITKELYSGSFITYNDINTGFTKVGVYTSDTGTIINDGTNIRQFILRLKSH